MALTKVTTSGLADDSVTSAKVSDGVISAADVADGTLTNAKLADGTIENAKLANSSITINGVSSSLGASVTIAAGTDWQTEKTTSFTAAAGEGYFVNTTSAAITATLPSSPTQGDEVSFIDYAGTFDSNNLTVARNGKNIQGSAADLTVATERAGFTLVFVDDTQGWLLKDK